MFYFILVKLEIREAQSKQRVALNLAKYFCLFSKNEKVILRIILRISFSQNIVYKTMLKRTNNYGFFSF